MVVDCHNNVLTFAPCNLRHILLGFFGYVTTELCHIKELQEEKKAQIGRGFDENWNSWCANSNAGRKYLLLHW